MVNTINPADCDRTTVYAGECRNFQDTEWITFDSGRRRSPSARDGNTWLVDVAHGSFWMADDKVRNLVPLVPGPAPAVSRADIEEQLRIAYETGSDPVQRITLAADNLCDLFGVEAEQAADPVEELAGQIEAATRTAIRQVCDDLATVAPSLDPLAVERAMEVAAASRKIAAHILGQEASDGR